MIKKFFFFSASFVQLKIRHRKEATDFFLLPGSRTHARARASKGSVDVQGHTIPLLSFDRAD